jgi:large subunit ribosomal protein L31
MAHLMRERSCSGVVASGMHSLVGGGSVGPGAAGPGGGSGHVFRRHGVLCLRRVSARRHWCAPALPVLTQPLLTNTMPSRTTQTRGVMSTTMRKEGIHPEWFPEAKVFCNGVEVMTVGGTKESYNVDIYSGNHPFYVSRTSGPIGREGRGTRPGARSAGKELSAVQPKLQRAHQSASCQLNQTNHPNNNNTAARQLVHHRRRRGSAQQVQEALRRAGGALPGVGQRGHRLCQGRLDEEGRRQGKGRRQGQALIATLICYR